MKNKIMKNALLTVSVLSVFICPVFALPPDPDNAALLYYQAFCVYEKPDDAMKDMVGNLAKGNIEPNSTITKYIENCHSAIKLAASTAELSKCDWGMKYSEGLDAQTPYVSQARMLTYLILADARITLAKADYNLAIQRCLTARKLGIDVGQDPLTIGFLVEKAIEKITNKCIQDILSSHAMELQTLQQLKAKLDELDSRIKPVEFFLKTEQEVMAMYITPERIREVIPLLDPCDLAREIILKADKTFCEQNLAYFNNYWSEIFPALKLPYQQAYSKLKELEKKYIEEIHNDNAIMARLLAPAVWKIYSNGVQNETFSNAVKAALEVYEIAAQTGKLPDSLPAGLPKDLFSGKDFAYEKTADGFILRCQGKDLDKDETYEYEFKVKK